MCDYSLMMFPSRLAAEGEHLIAHRFGSGSTGLVSLPDFTRWHTRPRAGFWQRCKECFLAKSDPAPVVCVPPGTKLRVQAIPQMLRDRYDLGFCADAIFTQVSADVNFHRDALRFGNGATVMLQSIPEGLTMKIVDMSSSESQDREPLHARMMRAG